MLLPQVWELVSTHHVLQLASTRLYQDADVVDVQRVRHAIKNLAAVCALRAARILLEQYD